MTTTYEVITGRQGKWWWIEILGVPAGYSQAKTFREVPAMAREVIALLLDVDQDSFDVTVSVRGDEAELIRQIEKLDAAAANARLAAMNGKRQAVRQLVDRKIPVRDIAEMLHVSPGYVSQLSNS
jgi:predicted RNase H-like HicB family nuclease